MSDPFRVHYNCYRSTKVTRQVSDLIKEFLKHIEKGGEPTMQFVEVEHEQLLKLRSKLNKALKLIKEHHDWHNTQPEIPQEFVGMNPAAEYGDSEMYQRTAETIHDIEGGF